MDRGGWWAAGYGVTKSRTCAHVTINQPPDSTLTLPLPDAEEAVLCSLETGTRFYLLHSHVIPASNLVSGT